MTFTGFGSYHKDSYDYDEYVAMGDDAPIFGKGRQKLQNFLPISCLVIKSAWLLVTLSRNDQRTTICP